MEVNTSDRFEAKDGRQEISALKYFLQCGVDISRSFFTQNPTKDTP